MDKRRLTYMILPFLSIFFAQFVTYWGNQQLAAALGTVGIDYSFILEKFNDAVPFLAWTVYPYVGAFPFWILTFFYVGYRSKDNLYKLLLMGLVTFGIFGIWYLVAQSDVQAWRETSGLFVEGADYTFTERFMQTIYAGAGPRNALPSMHCLMCWIAICGARLDKKMPWGAKTFIWAMAFAVMISTQTTKQHYIIDLLVAVAIGEIVFQIILRTNGWKKLEDAYSRVNAKLGLDWEGPTPETTGSE